MKKSIRWTDDKRESIGVIIRLGLRSRTMRSACAIARYFLHVFSLRQCASVENHTRMFTANFGTTPLGYFYGTERLLVCA